MRGPVAGRGVRPGRRGEPPAHLGYLRCRLRGNLVSPKWAGSRPDLRGVSTRTAPLRNLTPALTLRGCSWETLPVKGLAEAFDADRSCAASSSPSELLGARSPQLRCPSGLCVAGWCCSDGNICTVGRFTSDR